MTSYLETLKDLRAILKDQNLDGFLVTMNDPFQNEMVPDHFNRIRFLTGFTGSAGLLLITLQDAFFITDGRYTAQAHQEIDTSLFKIIEGGLPSLKKFIKRDLRLGCDAWAITESFYQALTRLPAQWVMSVDNFVDSLWKERPALPLEPIEVHEDCFSGRASSLKRIEISKTLETRGIKAFLLTTGDSISWLLNIRGGDIQDTPVPFSYAFLQNDASVDFFVDKKKISASVADFLGSSVRIHPLDAIEDFFTNMENIGLDPSVTPKAMVEKLGEGAWIPMDDPCRLPKACKNETEQQGAIDCHKVDGLAVTKFLYWVEQQEALTEIEASEKLASFRATGLHYKGPSFETISAVGPNGMLCHYRPKNKSRSFQKGDIYLVDSGGQYLNGTTDITRTVIWKGTPTKLQKLHYTLVLKGHIALATARFPKGTTGVQLDVLARQYLWQHGLDYSHGTGHGVGSYLSVHEAPPSISPRAGNTPLCAGMVISNEPGYYLKDHYGIRLENLVLVKESKDLTDFLEFETITLAPFDRRLMDETMLSDAEKTWLKSYHQRILDTFKDTLTEEEQAWVFEHSF